MEQVGEPGFFQLKITPVNFMLLNYQKKRISFLRKKKLVLLTLIH